MQNTHLSIKSGYKQTFMFRIITSVLLFGLIGFNLIHAQGTQVEFGKNRVQYHQDYENWSKYESDNFITYWYGEGREIGQFVVQVAELDFTAIQNILEHRINQRIQIIVYTDITDLKQSNIGVEETFNNTGGQTKIVGNKVFVYYDGDHNHLRRDVREGIASVYLDAMLFGSNLQEIVQNAVLMNLPSWFKEGLVSYVGEPWNTDLDNRLRDRLLNKEFEDFETLAEEDPELAGHALWYYISEQFGFSTVSNLLYLTRINRSVESGFLYVLNQSYEKVILDWTDYFKERYTTEVKERNAIKGTAISIKNKRNLPISEVKLSPDGKKLLYVMNEIGKYKVYLHDLVSGEREVIFKSGFRNAFQATDYNYPLLAWNPNGLEIAIMYEFRDVVKLLKYDITLKKSETEDMSTQYQRVYSMEYVNPISLVLSAAVRGDSDLFLYYTNTRQTQRLTNDYYDDLDATVVKINNQKGILFASNRQDSILQTERLDTILPINTFDIYYYDLENKSKELVRVTHTPLANERQPNGIDTTYFSYLSDRTGIHNREVAFLQDYIHHYQQIITLNDGEEIILHADSSLSKLDTAAIDTIVIEPVIKKRAIIHQNSNFDRAILEQTTATRTEKTASLYLKDNSHQIYIERVDTAYMPRLSFSHFQMNRINKLAQNDLDEMITNPSQQRMDDFLEIVKETKPIAEEETREAESIKINEGYLFQSEFPDEETNYQVVTIDSSNNNNQQVFSIPLSEEQIASTISNEQDIYKFRSSRIVPYRLEFRTDYVTTQLDNSFLFQGMESFAANQGEDFGYPPPGILLKINFKDLFEDYEFEGGVRVPTTFNGTEYFLVYKNKKKRLDKQFAVYRRNVRFNEAPPPGSRLSMPIKSEQNILLGQFSIRYPLDIFRSLRAISTLRRDRTTVLATERQTTGPLNPLETPTVNEQRMGLRLEYVFDNTLDVALNIKNGARYKVFAEVVKRFDLDISQELSFSFNDGFMGIVGVDARHYQRLFKHSVFATRFAGATSFGSEQMLYYIGGVDNWMFQQFNNEIPVSQTVNFAYQTLSTNLRGFDVNIRNGNTFLLANAELRMPIFRYLSKRIRSSFFRNFQVVGFFDIGTAWTGRDPYGPDNPINTTEIQNSDLVQVDVNFFRDPIVAGYGAGIRSMLFGYFVRLDYAWGVETRNVLDPKLYLSIGMDF